MVQAIEFETDDPAMRGEMNVTFDLSADGDGTLVHATHANLPVGLSAEHNEIGWSKSLRKLAELATSQTGS